MRSFWVFNIGTGEQAPPADWLAEWRHHTEEMWFPPNKRPSGVRAGDRAVINGSLRRGFIAVVEIVSTEPEDNTTSDEPDRKRWPWLSAQTTTHRRSRTSGGRTRCVCVASRT